MNLSFGAVILVSAVVLTGPIGAASVGFFYSLCAPRGIGTLRRFFGAGMIGNVGLFGGVAYASFGGINEWGDDLDLHETALHVLLPLAAAAVAMFLANSLMVALVIRLSTGIVAFSRAFLDAIRLAGASYAIAGTIAFAFVELWQGAGLGPMSLVLAIAPLALLQVSLTQQAQQQRMHYRTVETLVAAVEARHPSTTGVSQATAQIAQLIGDEMRLSVPEGDALRFGAMLHNIGLIAPRDDHMGATRLSPDQLQRHLTHPERGVEMLRDISFLADSNEVIKHHHERWDGQGYPEQLTGEDIPLLARIVTVADVFVSLVRRDGCQDVAAVVAAVQRRAATQLCPACVDALVRLHEKGRLDQLDLKVRPNTRIDHNDPSVSDLMSAIVQRERDLETV